MPALTTEYSGIALYFSKATSQSASLSGGMAPSSGCHSVIDSPLSVRRTAPPTTIMQKTRAATDQQPNLHGSVGGTRRVRSVMCGGNGQGPRPLLNSTRVIPAGDGPDQGAERRGDPLLRRA